MARRARGQKGLLWGTLVAAVVVLALTAYAALSGGDDKPEGGGNKGGGGGSSTPTAGPQPTYEPPADWDDPTRWATLPRGMDTDERDNAVGFPRTRLGAVATMVEATSTEVRGSRSNEDEQLDMFDSYFAQSDRTDANRQKIEAKAEATDLRLRKIIDASATGPLPAGAYVRSHVIGFKVVEASADEVHAYVLTRVTQKADETAKEKGSYTRTLIGVQWESGDWKVSSGASLRAAKDPGRKPEIVAPGDAAFNAAGWTAIRQAS